jgi:hypothetical protein
MMNVKWRVRVQTRPNPIQRCHTVSRSMPIRRSSHGRRATSTSCSIMIDARCRPKNLPTVSSEFLPRPYRTNRYSTTARWATTAVHSAARATVLTGMAIAPNMIGPPICHYAGDRQIGSVSYPTFPG